MREIQYDKIKQAIDKKNDKLLKIKNLTDHREILDNENIKTVIEENQQDIQARQEKKLQDTLIKGFTHQKELSNKVADKLN